MAELKLSTRCTDLRREQWLLLLSFRAIFLMDVPYFRPCSICRRSASVRCLFFSHDILLFSIFAQDTVGNDVIYILHGNRRLGHTKRNGSPMGEIISSTYVVDQHL